MTLPVAFGVVVRVARTPMRAPALDALHLHASRRDGVGGDAADVDRPARGARAARRRCSRACPAVVDAVDRATRPPRSFTPALDLAAMSQQYVHSRLFRS